MAGLLSYFAPEADAALQRGIFNFVDAFPDNRARRLQEEEMRRRQALQDEELAYTRKQRGLLDQQLERERADEGLLTRLIGMPVEQPMPADQMGPGAPMANPGVDPRTFLAQGGSLGGLGRVQGVNSMLIPPVKKPEYKVVDGALVKIDDGGVSEAYRAPERPKEVAPSDLGRLLAERDALPPNSPLRPYYDRRIEKLNAPPTPQTIVMGAPVPVQLPDGTVGYAQPANRPGAQPQLMTSGPGGKPLTKPVEEKPFTEGQAKAVAFAARMRAADQALAQLARKGVRASVPGSMGSGTIADALTALSPPEMQQLNQAKRDFVNAVLRRESGAVIADSEFANAERQYFPQIGDSKAVIEQKARNRRTAIEGIMADIPKNRRSEVDRISGSASAPDESDPLGLRGR